MGETKDKAKVKKPFYKKWWFWVLVILIIGGIGSAGSGSGSKDDIATAAAPAETTTAAAATAAETTTAVAETVAAENWTHVVQDTKHQATYMTIMQKGADYYVSGIKWPWDTDDYVFADYSQSDPGTIVGTAHVEIKNVIEKQDVLVIFTISPDGSQYSINSVEIGGNIYSDDGKLQSLLDKLSGAGTDSAETTAATAADSSETLIAEDPGKPFYESTLELDVKILSGMH